MRKFLILSATMATVVATVPGAAQATSTTCSTSTVCAEYVNTYSGGPGGVAIHGEANGGIGIRGTSVTNVGFYGASGSGSLIAPGVEGESTNTDGSDAGGAFGLASLSNKANTPHFGAAGLGLSAGVIGQVQQAGTSMTASGYGAEGFDSVNSASSSGDYNVGVFGDSRFGTAVLAEASGTPSAGLFSKVPIGVYSVANTASGTPVGNAYAFVGESNYAGLDLLNTGSTNYALIADSAAFYLLGQGSTTGSGSFFVSTSGNAMFSGTVTTSMGTYVRTTGSNGEAMREYGTRSTAPDVEDVGEGQLTNGHAYVPIDARLANTIDRRVAYHVFVTPEGDCKGLYVTQKSPAGFAVRELQGGRSALAFEYRIVAKPIDENGTRLATMPAETLPKDAAIDRGVKRERIAPPLSIEDDLKRRLGPQGYAKALADLRARLSGR